MNVVDYHIFISGFTQSMDQWTGTEKIRQHAKQMPEVNCAEVELLLPLRWNANMGAIAEYISRNVRPKYSARIYVYAYSWGAGYGFRTLAKQLQKRGHSIERAILCDPVYHSWSRMWRGMFRFSWNPPIVVPHNVKHVDHFFQRNNVPQAAYLQAADPKRTKISKGVQLDRIHAYMDDAPEYFEAVISLIKSVSPC